MSLMDKFSTVEIKADNRISEEDKEFCVRNQNAFDKSGPALQKIADLMIAAKLEQQNSLQVGGDRPYQLYTIADGFSCDEDRVYKAMKHRNTQFINTITNYFSDKYNVELDTREIQERLIPTGPSEPKLPWGGYREMTDEQIDAFKKELDDYKVEQGKSEQRLRNLPLRYEQIVDEIFVQLGGFSFQEQAMNEFHERVWDCCHQSWGEHKEKFEIKNDVLRLSPHSSWLCVDENKWMNDPVPTFKPQDDLRTLAEALAHYECGRTKEGGSWYPELCEYRTDDSVFTCHHKYVASIKFFKNSRIDIKFRSAAYAMEFVEKYLRRKVA